MNDDLQESSILFTVEMQSSSKDIHDRTIICFSEEGDNKGLAIYVIYSPYSFIHDIDSDRRFRAILAMIPWPWIYMSFCPSTPTLTSLLPTCHSFRRILVIFVNILPLTSFPSEVHIVQSIARCMIIWMPIWNVKTAKLLYFSLCRLRKFRW